MWWWNNNDVIEELMRKQLVALKLLVVEQRKTNETLNKLADKLDLIADAIISPPNPGKLILIKTGETEMDKITFDVQLPALPPEPNDIEKGELTVVIGGGEPQVMEVGKHDTVVTGLSGDQDATVDLSFVYVDDAGNKSDTPSILSVMLTDEVPPPVAGQLGVVVTGEQPEEEPS